MASIGLIALGIASGLLISKWNDSSTEPKISSEDFSALVFHVGQLSEEMLANKIMKENLAAIPVISHRRESSVVEAMTLATQENGGGIAPRSRFAAEIDGLADMLAVYRAQYRQWREGDKQRPMRRIERELTRGYRSNTDTSDTSAPMPLGDPAAGEKLSTHLWQHLNMGPTKTQPCIKITVIGGGAFGTAMAAAAAQNNHNVVVFVRRDSQAQEINEHHTNTQYLGDLKLPDNVTATTSLEEALANTGLIIHALPAQRSPDWIKENRKMIPRDIIYCNTAKGLHLESKSLLSAAMKRAFNRDQPMAVLSGPSFAKEIVSKQPTTVVVASNHLAHAVKVQRLMSSNTFRIYASQDMVGVELGGALKNPLAVGAGMIEGLGFGINTMSAYVSRSCAELTSLCVAMGGRPETIAGLAGIGDLMLTAFGSLSRNRTCGIRLVKGETLEDILATTTVEGVPTAKVAVLFANECNLHLPIFRAVDDILTGKMKAEDFVVTSMMNRPLAMETHVAALSEVSNQQ